MKFIPHKTKLKSMELPRVVMIGQGAIDTVAITSRRLKLGKRAIVINDARTFKVAGRRVTEQLSDDGFEAKNFKITGNDEKDVERVLALTKASKADLLLGVGGGKSIDIAKYSAFKTDIPFFSIPTAASHDGIASSRATLEIGRMRASMEAQPPLAIIADTNIIAASPFKFTVSGCGDILANHSAVADWMLAHRLKGEEYSNYAAALSSQTAEMLVENIDQIKPNLEESARFMLKALVSSGIAMSIAGSSRPASGSEHMFSHALDMIAKKPALHGMQCGVGTILMLYLHGLDWRRVKDALKVIHAPVTAKALGVSRDEVLKALTYAHKIRPERYTILGNGISPKTAEKAAKDTGVI